MKSKQPPGQGKAAQGACCRKSIIRDVTGVILAGGQSTRFGSDKGLALLNGVPLIKHVAGVLDQIFLQRLLVTNTPDAYSFLGWPQIRDEFADEGPLTGIHAALKYSRTPFVFITGCDMPFLDSGLISYLCGLAFDGDVIVPWLDKGPEPLFAIYHKEILPFIEERLVNQERSIRLMFDRLRIRRVTRDEIISIGGDLNAFYNVNQPGDMPFSGSPKGPLGNKFAF